MAVTPNLQLELFAPLGVVWREDATSGALFDYNMMLIDAAVHSGGAVASVNGQVGVVVLSAASVGADASGAAATAQSTAETFATNAVATETSRAETAEALLAPKASPTFTGTVSGITYTMVGADASGAAAAAQTAAENFATNADTTVLSSAETFATSAVATETSRAETAEALLAPKASPTFTGTVSGKTLILSDTAANTDLLIENTTAASSVPATWGYYSSITIAHGQVAGSLVNFPVLIAGTYSQLATTAHGGYVQNANGYDVIFSTTTSAANKLPHEVVSYNATTGAVIYNVQVPGLSSSTDTVIYVLYGNSSISTDQSNPTAVWDANFKQVSHLNEASAAQVLDSTSNGNNSTSNNGTSVTGKWGTATNFLSSSSQKAVFPNIFATAPTAFTISEWINCASSVYGIAYDGRGSGGTGGVLLYTVQTTGKANGQVSSNNATSSQVAADGTWHFIAMTWNGAQVTIQVDGNAPTSANAASDTAWQAGVIGESVPTPGTYYTSSNQELRISNIARPAAWLKTEYNNQNSPGTFYSVGSAIAVTVPVNASSPVQAFDGAYWNGASSVADSWTIQSVPASAGSVLNIANTGGSTSPVVNVPALTIGGVSAELALFNNGVGAMFYPEAYGAVHTLGSDDTAAIQAAINAAQSNGGGTVCLGRYTYYLYSAPLVVSASNVNICGVGMRANAGSGAAGSWLMNMVAGSDTLQMTGTSSSVPISANRLYNFSLLRNVMPTGTASGLKWTYALNTVAENVDSWDSIYCFSFNHIVGSNNHINCIAYYTTVSAGAGTCYGFWFDGNGNNSTDLTKCITSQVSSRPTTLYGLYLSGGIIADLYCDELNTAYTSTAVYVNATNNTQPGSYYNDDIIFTRCIHDTCGGLAYSINNVYGNQANIQILGGYMLSVASANLVTISNSTGVVLKDVGLFPHVNANAAIYLTGSNTQGCVIENNVIYNTESGQTCILLNSCLNNVVSGNTIQAASSGVAFANGIALTSATYNVIEGNVVYGYGTTGISIDSASTNNVGTGNSVNPANITNLLTDAGSYNTVVVTGSQRLARVSHSGNYTTTVPDNVVVFTATATLTLDSGAAQKGTTYRIKLSASATGGSVLTISPNNSKTIDGSSSLVISTLGNAVDVVYDGSTNWDVLSVAVSQVAYSVALTGQTGTIGATNLVATPVTTALYEITYYLNDTTAGTGGTVSLTITWNDGASQTFTSSNVTFGTAGAFVSGIIVVKATSGAIQYATTVTSAVGSPAYSLDLRVTQLV